MGKIHGSTCPRCGAIWRNSAARKGQRICMECKRKEIGNYRRIK